MHWLTKFIQKGKLPTGNPGTGLPYPSVDRQLRKIVKLLEEIAATKKP